MVSKLRKIVVPELRKRGFKGSFPHFRRNIENKLDLITFQFDNYGGGFVIEVGVCSLEGFTNSLGDKVSPNKVTAHDLTPNNRLRLKENDGQWFRYDIKNESKDIYENVAIEVLKHLYETEEYWKNNR